MLGVVRKRSGPEILAGKGGIMGVGVSDIGGGDEEESETTAKAGPVLLSILGSGSQIYPLMALAATTAGEARYACALGWPMRPL